jgi:Holliday junction resolvase RusA-like endonuclease
MTKNTRWSPDDLKKAGLIEVNGVLVKASSQVAKGPIDKINLPPDFVSVKNINALYPNGRVEPICVPPDFNGCYTVVFKPMSVNEAWKGKRYRSDKYNAYKLAVGCLLPKHVIIPDGLLKVYYEFGLSSNGGDWDNPVKPLQDILQEAYQFNDSRIMEASVKKVIVPKGSEYIRFKIESLC